MRKINALLYAERKHHSWLYVYIYAQWANCFVQVIRNFVKTISCNLHITKSEYIPLIMPHKLHGASVISEVFLSDSPSSFTGTVTRHWFTDCVFISICYTPKLSMPWMIWPWPPSPPVQLYIFPHKHVETIIINIIYTLALTFHNEPRSSNTMNRYLHRHVYINCVSDYKPLTPVYHNNIIVIWYNEYITIPHMCKHWTIWEWHLYTDVWCGGCDARYIVVCEWSCIYS